MCFSFEGDVLTCHTPLTPRILQWWLEPISSWDLVCPLAYMSYEVI